MLVKAHAPFLHPSRCGLICVTTMELAFFGSLASLAHFFDLKGDVLWLWQITTM